MASLDPRAAQPRGHQRWQRAGVAGIAVVAIVLFGASLWLAEEDASSVTVVGSAGSKVPAAAPSHPASGGAVGSLERSAITAPLAELPPVPLTEQAAPVPGLEIGVAALAAVDSMPVGGQIGPALRVTVTVQNDTDAAVSLRSTVVTLSSSSAEPSRPGLPDPAGVEMPSSVAPGARASGDFLFAVPVEERALVRVGVAYATGMPAVVFSGAAPG
jgi:hypothetical protein